MADASTSFAVPPAVLGNAAVDYAIAARHFAIVCDDR